MSKFIDLTEEELIEILNKDDLNEDELKELIAAMEGKGLKGMITAVDPNSEAGRVAVEYIEYHKKINPVMPLSEIEVMKKNLFLTKVDIENKKKALVSLAHVGRPDVFEALKQYNQKPDWGLEVWSDMALQECRTFLETDILEEGGISVMALNNK
ncbi:MAG: hypothetical protein WCT37_04730 [Patescibacteria group bacterium]|jgi:hypothetical protein